MPLPPLELVLAEVVMPPPPRRASSSDEVDLLDEQHQV